MTLTLYLLSIPLRMWLYRKLWQEYKDHRAIQKRLDCYVRRPQVKGAIGRN